MRHDIQIAEQKTVVLFHSKDSVNVRLTQRDISAYNNGNIKNAYVSNRSEYFYFLHETRNLLPILGFYNLTSDLSTLLTVHGQMNSRKASASKAV
jgi:hypothetical protein